MTIRFNPLDYPSCLMRPPRASPSHWTEHVPFAYSLVEMLRPRVVVELGVFAGVSYCALCQAVDRLGLPCQAYGVDTWQGDPHNGVNGPEVLQDLKAHHDPLYGRFSRLIAAAFDDALPQFADGSIDLLHIDGYHTYDAVRRDFENWLPKMSERGVMLFHDVNVHEMDFGVWKLWDELKARYRSFEFAHQHGLGVLAVGPNPPAPLIPLLEAGEEETARVRDFYFQLGRRITQAVDHRRIEDASLARLAQATEASAARLALVTADFQTALAAREVLLKELYGRLAEAEQQLQVFRLQFDESDDLVRRERARLSGELTAVCHSFTYRCASVISRVGRTLAPAGSRRRRVLQAARRGAGLLRREGVAGLVRRADRPAA